MPRLLHSRLRIFISHSHTDNPFGVKLVNDLRLALGNEDAVWYDARGGLHGGEAWWRKIVQEITDRNIFIIILSPEALSSKWVQDEIDIAWNQKNETVTGIGGPKLIIPLLYRECKVRADLRMLQIISFLPPKSYKTSLSELIDALEQFLDRFFPASLMSSSSPASSATPLSSPSPAVSITPLPSSSIAPPPPPLYSPSAAPVQSRKPGAAQEGISRRAVLVGLAAVGLAATGGGVAWWAQHAYSNSTNTSNPQIFDVAQVLDTTKVKGEAAKLPFSMSIYTTKSFSGTSAEFNQIATNHLTDPRLIVMSIDTVNRFLVIVGGNSVPLTNSQYNDAVNAFRNNFNNGDYTGASIAAIDSLLNALSTHS